MITASEILQHAREAGKAAALDLAARAPEMTGTQIIDEQDSVPAWNPQGNYLQSMIGYPVQYDDQVYTLLQAHNASYYPSTTPPALPALWSITHTTDPKKAKPWVAPNGQSGLYKIDECCTENGHVHKNTHDNNEFSPSALPERWEDLGTIEEVQG